MKAEAILPLVFTVVVAGGIHERPCATGQFFDGAVRHCKPCSKCPPNQIVRRLCGGDNDVWCGDFLEFNEFNQQPGNKVAVKQNSTVQDNGDTDKQKNQQNSMSSERGWRKLSMALVIVLSLGLTLSACGVLAFYLWRKRRAVSKEITTVVYQRDPLSNDAANSAANTFPRENPSPRQATTFVPQPGTSGERKRSPKKNDYVKLFRPSEKGRGEIDLDMEEKMAGFVSSDTQDRITESENCPQAGTSSTSC